jgi:hypothetical protein
MFLAPASAHCVLQPVVPPAAAAPLGRVRTNVLNSRHSCPLTSTAASEPSTSTATATAKPSTSSCRALSADGAGAASGRGRVAWVCNLDERAQLCGLRVHDRLSNIVVLLFLADRNALLRRERCRRLLKIFGPDADTATESVHNCSHHSRSACVLGSKQHSQVGRAFQCETALHACGPALQSETGKRAAIS